MSTIKTSYGVKITSFCLRHAPNLTNSLSNKVGRLASPITQALLKRDYKLGETRLEAMKHNYRAHYIYPQSLREAKKLEVQGHLTEFLTAMQNVLPTTAEANRSVINALTGRPDGRGPKERILDFVRAELPKYLKRLHGMEFAWSVFSIAQGNGLSDEYRTPKISTLLDQMYESLTAANILTWFTNPTGPVVWTVDNTTSMWGPHKPDEAATWSTNIVPTK